jgi:hypothetical protein
MNENLVTYSFTIGLATEGSTIGANAFYFMVPFGATLVHVSAAPFLNGTGDIDINDDGSEIIAAIDATTKNAPGEWISTHFGGTNAPIEIAAGSVLDFDVNTGDAACTYNIILSFLQGSTWG